MSTPSFPHLPAIPSGKIFILDSSALLRYLDREAGVHRVREILDAHADGICRSIMTSLHWGEVVHKLIKRHGMLRQEEIVARLLAFQMELIPATTDRAVRSARIQARLRIPYVDAFGVELAAESPNHTFVTADYDLKPAANEVSIEFLPVK